MKVFQLHKSHSSTDKTISLDKQNQSNKSNNLIKKHLVGAAQQANKKLGVEIRNRIQKPLQQRNALKQSIIQNLNDSSFRDSQTILGKDSRLSKNVSFDDGQRSSLNRINRQISKKSILKSSQGKLRKSPSLQRSQVSMANSHVDYQDQSVENTVGNKVIIDKYEKLKEQLATQNHKFRDQIYPPVKNSMYLNNSLMKNFCEIFQKQGRSIEWMRISELYRNKKMVIWSSQKQHKNTILNGHISKTGGDRNFLANVFNSIKQKNSLLQKMFQSQQVNNQCIYYVKIHQTQTNIWKYILIDDFIPVIINKELPQKQRYMPDNIHPAFINICSQSQVVEIWPFLLQKAFAKYYSTYDSLGNGNTLDFLEQITGIFLEQTTVKSNLQKINKLMMHQDVLLIAQDKRGHFYPIKGILQQKNERKYVFLDQQQSYQQKALSAQQFITKFVIIYYSQLHKYYFTSKCQIQQEGLRKKTESEIYPNILRQFTITQQSDCQVGVIQKQQRFYRSYLTYQYAWMRLILVQKQRNSYRWIGAVYNNQKSTKIVANLTPGQYVIIILPQWKEKAYNFNLIYRGNSQILFQRKAYNLYPNIVEQSCMDLAQRYGKMAQINKNICSYNLIDKNIGFVIENINNQKENGSIRIVRSIEGLQSYHIKPINSQFKDKLTIEISIPKRSHFTVVLMTTRGTEKGFLDSFDFGF